MAKYLKMLIFIVVLLIVELSLVKIFGLMPMMDQIHDIKMEYPFWQRSLYNFLNTLHTIVLVLAVCYFILIEKWEKIDDGKNQVIIDF